MENVAKFKVEGIGARKTGNKDGRPYDFVTVCMTYEDPYIDGKMCFNEGINYDMFAKHNLKVGSEFDAVYQYRKFQPHILVIL